MGKTVKCVELLPNALFGAGIYLLICEGRVIYIGQSVVLLHRVAEHIRRLRSGLGFYFDEVRYVACTKDELNELEGRFIKKFRPRFNRAAAPSGLPENLRQHSANPALQNLIANIQEARAKGIDEGFAAFDEEDIYFERVALTGERA